MEKHSITCHSNHVVDDIKVNIEYPIVSSSMSSQHKVEHPLKGNSPLIKEINRQNNKTIEINHVQHKKLHMAQSVVKPTNSDVTTSLANPIGKENTDKKPNIKTERLQSVKLPVKTKSCMKFTRNSKTNRKVNDFESTPESRWNKWKRMCTEYEYDKSKKYDIFKANIEKFKIPRRSVSYEADPEIVAKDIPGNVNKNDSVIEGMIPRFDPTFNYKDEITSSDTIELDNNDPIESNFASYSDKDKFLLPSTVKCNYKNVNPFLPHLKGQLRINDKTLVAYFLDDTGASNSMVSQQWLKKYHPQAKIKVFNQNFTACGKTQSKGIVGQVRLTITFENSNNERIDITDDFYIVTETGNLQFILGRSVLGDSSLVKKQTPSDITFYKQESEITIPFVNMSTSQQNTTVQINNFSIPMPPLPSTLILSPIDRVKIPANAAMYIKCYLPEIQKINAPQLHGKVILIGRDNLEPAQAIYAPATLDVLTKCQIDEFGRLTCTTRIHNQSGKPFTVTPDHILGHGTFIDNTEEGKMSYEELFHSKSFLDHLTMDQLKELKDVIDIKLQRNKILECNHSEASNPIIIPLEDNFDKRDPRFHEKANWRPAPDQNITDNLNVTELRPDMVKETEQSQLSEEEYLRQFDLDHLPVETQSLFKDIFLQVRTTFATEVKLH